ncbi:hypothetical protein [Litorisediminicola beolgyonensis]|uniref:TrbC/VIRB2 family protein n=1 Tax=Litorisediminicola beolgyonensis TaxID=1173614 RepID=A0ABW3ZKF4_9RHOB
MSLTFGLLVLVFAIPSMVAAYADGKAPRFGAVTFVLGVGMILMAFATKDGGYALGELPTILFKVIGRFVG